MSSKNSETLVSTERRSCLLMKIKYNMVFKNSNVVTSNSPYIKNKQGSSYKVMWEVVFSEKKHQVLVEKSRLMTSGSKWLLNNRLGSDQRP